MENANSIRFKIFSVFNTYSISGIRRKWAQGKLVAISWLTAAVQLGTMVPDVSLECLLSHLQKQAKMLADFFLITEKVAARFMHADYKLRQFKTGHCLPESSLMGPKNIYPPWACISQDFMTLLCWRAERMPRQCTENAGQVPPARSQAVALWLQCVLLSTAER